MLNAGGYLVGNFLSGRYGMRFGADRLINVGLWLSLISLSAAVLLALLPSWGVLTLFVPMFFNAIGNGLTIPSATAAALSVRPEVAGAAAGVAGSLQLGAGALFAYITGIIVPWWPASLVVMMWLFMVVAMISSNLNRFRRND
jgi:DHA1 family bicyclomycin/chloramphenicol resistance-like MFS transporter